MTRLRARALTWAPLAEEGKIILVGGGCVSDFLDEVSAFPGSDHDDQIDAGSIAVALLQKPNHKAWGSNKNARRHLRGRAS